MKMIWVKVVSDVRGNKLFYLAAGLGVLLLVLGYFGLIELLVAIIVTIFCSRVQG